MHAIGDLANRNALDAFEETRTDWQPLGLRHRIEHAQCLAPEDVPRFAELGVAASVQFSHAPSDAALAERFWADRLDGRLRVPLAAATSGARARQRLGRADRGARLRGPGSSPASSATGARSRRVTRRAGARGDDASTPAWLTGDERRRGKLLPGYLADLVVLDRDPLAIPADELPEVQVVATMVGGRWTHNPPPW